MIFIPNGWFGAIDVNDSNAHEFFILEKDVICFVIEHCEAGMRHCPNERSLILHPARGLCKAFVSRMHGEILL